MLRQVSTGFDLSNYVRAHTPGSAPSLSSIVIIIFYSTVRILVKILINSYVCLFKMEFVFDFSFIFMYDRLILFHFIYIYIWKFLFSFVQIITRLLVWFERREEFQYGRHRSFWRKSLMFHFTVCIYSVFIRSVLWYTLSF